LIAAERQGLSHDHRCVGKHLPAGGDQAVHEHADNIRDAGGLDCASVLSPELSGINTTL
jgi:hypothetical protein